MSEEQQLRDAGWIKAADEIAVLKTQQKAMALGLTDMLQQMSDLLLAIGVAPDHPVNKQLRDSRDKLIRTLQ